MHFFKFDHVAKSFAHQGKSNKKKEITDVVFLEEETLKRILVVLKSIIRMDVLAFEMARIKALPEIVTFVRCVSMDWFPWQP